MGPMMRSHQESRFSSPCLRHGKHRRWLYPGANLWLWSHRLHLAEVLRGTGRWWGWGHLRGFHYLRGGLR